MNERGHRVVVEPLGGEFFEARVRSMTPPSMPARVRDTSRSVQSYAGSAQALVNTWSHSPARHWLTNMATCLTAKQ